MWNTQSVKHLKNVLLEHSVYRNDADTESVYGKTNVLDFFRFCFRRFQDYSIFHEFSYSSNVVLIEGYDYEAFVELCYHLDGEISYELVRVVEWDDLIESIYIFPKSNLKTTPIN